MIRVGLRELQGIDGANDFYHLPLLTLANGFERYMKVILCLHEVEQSGRFPSRSQLLEGRKGHDLSHLLQRIVNECFSPRYVERIPVGSEDVAYLRDNERLRKIVELLSRFGQAARYYHLDVILGEEPGTDSPEDEWSALEMEILETRPELIQALGEPGTIDHVFEYLRRELTATLERFARALARLFTIGRLGELARQNMAIVTEFLLIRDDELGTRPY